MKRIYSGLICLITCFLIVFCTAGCNILIPSKNAGDAGNADNNDSNGKPAETYARTIEQDVSDLRKAGYVADISDGMEFGMFEPISAVEKMLLVDLSTENVEHYLCIMYFPSEDVLQENLSEYTRFKEYLAGPMPNYANERTVLTHTDRCFIVATNNGIDLLSIVEHNGNHEHTFGSWSVVSRATTEEYELSIRTCNGCGTIELKTGSTLAK